jgi:plastocyanin
VRQCCAHGAGAIARRSAEITISVTATGFKPKEAELAVGGRARFENIDDRLHSIASNPLLTHADCPPINEVGVLVPGQPKMTGALTEAKTCGYHDTASAGSGQVLMGTITVRPLRSDPGLTGFA